MAILGREKKVSISSYVGVLLRTSFVEFCVLEIMVAKLSHGGGSDLGDILYGPFLENLLYLDIMFFPFNEGSRDVDF